MNEGLVEMLTHEFNVGDRVSQKDNGFGVPFESGTIKAVNVSDDGHISYDVLWDDFDWITINWTEEDFILLEKN